jgi:hypothetical protein
MNNREMDIQEFHTSFVEGGSLPRYVKMRTHNDVKTILVIRFVADDCFYYSDQPNNFNLGHEIFEYAEPGYTFKYVKPPVEPREPSARLQEKTQGIKYQGFEQDMDCTGSKDPLLIRSKIVNGIRLECDNQCYDISSLADWYLSGNHSAPTRAVFTPRDIERIEAYIEHNKPPGVGGRKRRTIRKNKKSKKSKKSNNSRRKNKKGKKRGHEDRN